MRQVRSLVKQWPALAISITALTFSLAGGATAAQGHLGVTTTTRVTWHTLKLVNSWSNAGGPTIRSTSFGTNGTGVVYIAGMIENAKPHGSVFAVLPRGNRPAHTVNMLIANAFTISGPGIADLIIQPNGDMSLEPFGTGNESFAYLDGHSFPIGQ
jgi:hypothetical protein